MNQKIQLKYGGGKEFEAFHAWPDKPGSGPGIILIHDFWGLDGNIQDTSDRLSKEGFIIIAPDLISETSVLEKINPSIFSDLQNPAKRHEAETILKEATLPLSSDEFKKNSEAKIKACFDFLMNDPGMNGNAGIIGFGWGGSIIYHFLESEPRFKACVIFHGQMPQSLEGIIKINPPILAFYGEQDSPLTAALPQFAEAMKKYGKDFTYFAYPHAGQMFYNETDLQNYNQPATEDSWNKAFDFLRKNLGYSFANSNQYIPGLRNIGPGSTSFKLFMGWAGLGLALVLWLFFIIFDQTDPWGLILFIPALISALGFLQAGFHFSIILAVKGMFNFGYGNDAGRSVTQAEFKIKDRLRSLELITYAILIALIFSLMVFLSRR